MNQKLPWYLKKTSVYIFCILMPPIGYLILLINLNKFEYKERIEYLSIATIMTAIWLLKFLPETLNNIVWILIITFLIGSTIIGYFQKKK